jgi:hypothetical protein
MTPGLWPTALKWGMARDQAPIAQACPPPQERIWWSYRPLTTDTFFFVGFRLLGLNPLGYLLISLGAHFACGLIVYRFARRFGLSSQVSTATALLSVSRPPALGEMFWISNFQQWGIHLALVEAICLL